MGMFFDFFDIEEKKRETEARDRALDMVLDMLAEASPRKAAEVKLLKISKKMGGQIIDKGLECAMNESLSDEQIESMTNYFEMVMAGFDTFIEQFESTVEKENPHNSGN